MHFKTLVMWLYFLGLTQMLKESLLNDAQSLLV